MKNFSDLTGINTNDKLHVDIQLEEHEDAVYVFMVNDSTISSVNYNTTLDLFESITLKCFIQKGAVEVKSATVNGFEVLPIYQKLAIPPTNWITTSWEFSIPSPFYVWKHDITGQGRIF